MPLLATEVIALLGGAAVPPLIIDQAMSLALLIACAVYLYLAVARVYATRGILRILQTLVLIAAVFEMFMVYRALLLPTTLYTT